MTADSGHPPAPEEDKAASYSPAKELKWHENSFVYVIFSFLLLPQSSIAWLVLFFFGLINLKTDPWHKNRFQVFLVTLIAMVSVMRVVYMRVISGS